MSTPKWEVANHFQHALDGRFFVYCDTVADHDVYVAKDEVIVIYGPLTTQGMTARRLDYRVAQLKYPRIRRKLVAMRAMEFGVTDGSTEV